MSFLGNGGDPTKKIRLYRNGDDNFFGKDFVLNRRQCRNYDVFLQLITDHLQFGQSVRSIHTPVGGTEIVGLDNLQDKGDYVAVGNGRFKKLPYPQLNNRRAQKLTESKTRNEMNTKTCRNKNDNRIFAEVTRRATKSTPDDVISIWVYCNGNEFEPAKRVILKPRAMQNWGLIYTEINQHIDQHFGAVRCLYTMDGSLVRDINQLQTGYCYVASSRHPGFKSVAYGTKRIAFNVSPKQQQRSMHEHEDFENNYKFSEYREIHLLSEPVAQSKTTLKKNLERNYKVIYSDGTQVFRRPRKKNVKMANLQKNEISRKQSCFINESNREEIHREARVNDPSYIIEGSCLNTEEFTADDAAAVIQAYYRRYRRQHGQRIKASSTSFDEGAQH